MAAERGNPRSAGKRQDDMRASREAEYTEYVQARLGWLRRTAYLLCQDWQGADDLAQKAITRLYTHWGRAGEAASLDAYVRGILVKAFLDECLGVFWCNLLGHHVEKLLCFVPVPHIGEPAFPILMVACTPESQELTLLPSGRTHQTK